jgi:hypothetical protein
MAEPLTCSESSYTDSDRNWLGPAELVGYPQP